MKKGIFSEYFLIFLTIIWVAGLAKATKPLSIFILGDSTADVGTNNHLSGSQARADFPFNGIDFPFSRPTGRFSNAFNSADFLAKFMGLRRSPPPFLFLVGLKSGLQKRFQRGVNFASGGSGLLDITGQKLKVVPLSEQIKQFETVRDNLTAAIGPSLTQKFLSKSVFFISIGSNDLFGYFLTNSTIPKQDFITLLMTAYETHIKTLYGLGARKFGIISVPPVGCCPAQRIFNATGGCLDVVNLLAREFYSGIDALLCKISSGLPDMKYSLGNTYEMTINVIENPRLFNFKNVDTACCGSGALNAENPCNRSANLCPIRSDYLFWDLYHPTHTAAHLAAITLYGGPKRFVSPINFSQLIEEN